MNRATAISATIAAVTFLGLGPAARAEPKRLRLAAVNHATEIDPYVTPAPNVSDLAWLYADGLVGVGPVGPCGLLATSVPSRSAGSIRNSGRTIYYRLRKGIMWHDGRAFRAEDVVAAFRRIQDSPWRSSRPYGLVRRIVSESAETLRVDLSEPDPAFPLSFFSVFGDPSVPLIRAGTYPLGTGPFAVRGFSERTGSYHLVAWRPSPRGTPRSQVIAYTLLQDQATEGVAFAAGEFDIALYVPRKLVEARHLEYARYSPGVIALFANTSGVLADVRRRRAVFTAVDRQTIRTSVFGNWGLPSDNLLSPTTETSFRFPQEAGTSRRRGARIAHPIPKGTQLVFASIPGIGDQIGILLQAQLQRAGIDVVIKSFSPQEYFALDGPLHSGKFDLALDIMPYTSDPDLSSKFSCAANKLPGRNYSRFCNHLLDDAIAKQDFNSAMQILSDNAVIMPIAQIINCIGIGSRVKTFRVADYVPITYYCNEWSLE